MHKLPQIRQVYICPVFIYLLIFCSIQGYTQSAKSDSTTSVVDSLSINLGPSADSTLNILETKDTTLMLIPEKKVGVIKSVINYSAKDSIKFDVITKKVRLYGDAKIDYGEIKLEAAEIEIDWVTSDLTAQYVLDSAGKKIGKPIFKDGGEEYYTDNIIYNFKSKKAIITGLVTTQGDANIRGSKVVKNSKDELFIPEAKYTTCNLPDPHFYISARRLKVIPKEKIVSGPFNLKFLDIPTPLAFPFGMFPDTKESKSGIIFPTYGNEPRRRGYFLRGGGYFFDISEYIKLKVTGEIYTRGSRGLNLSSSYKKRYRYSGNINFDYNKLTSGVEGDSSSTNDFWINISHTPQSKGTSRFGAAISMGTSSFNANNSQDLSLNSRQTWSSSANYSKTFKGTPFNMSTSFRVNQNTSTRKVDVTFPDLSLNMSRIYPLKGLGGSKKTWYKDINLSYAFNLDNRFSNQLNGVENVDGGDSIAPFTPENFSLFFDNAQNGAKHSIPLSTSMKIFKYFSFNPSLKYDGWIYLRRLNHTYNAETDLIEQDTIGDLSFVHTFSTGGSLNTRLFGMYNFGRGKVQAIRHVATPSISFTYKPDFSDPSYGYFQEVETKDGETELISRYKGFAQGGPSQGESASVSFSLSNNIEMKVRDDKDSTSTTGTKKIPLLENLSLGGSYNFLADSINLSNISIAARTKVAGFDISLSGTLDPYTYRPLIYDEEGNVTRDVKINEFAWNNGGGLGQLTRGSIRLSKSFRPESSSNRKRNEDSNDGPRSLDDRLDEIDTGGDLELEEEIQNIKNSPDQYVDFDIPWDLRFNYSLTYTNPGLRESELKHSLTFSGNLSLTQQWKLRFSSGYDVKNKEFLSSSSLGISRDLHCWTMSFDWTPIGRFESYSFSIRAKSSLLQDLKIDRRRSFRGNPGF